MPESLTRKRLAAKRLERKVLNHQRCALRHSYLVQYMKDDTSEMNVLCDRYGSDKGEVKSGGHPYPWPSHNYADFYESIFHLRKNDVALVIECGLGSNDPDMVSSMGIDGRPGASLRLWRDYFPKARIIGVDIDTGILFSEDRISTFECDQTSRASIETFVEKADLVEESADIIIDDGLHRFHAGRSFFEGMIKYLSPQGVYVIEDVAPADMPLYKDYFLDMARSSQYAAQFVSLWTPEKPVCGDNQLVVVRKK